MTDELDLDDEGALEAARIRPSAATSAPETHERPSAATGGRPEAVDAPEGRVAPRRFALEDLEPYYSQGVIKSGIKDIQARLITRLDDPDDPEADGTGRYEVTGSTGDVYSTRVLAAGDGLEHIPYVTCNCANGQAKGGRPTCHHSAAALIAHLDMVRVGR